MCVAVFVCRSVRCKMRNVQSANLQMCVAVCCTHLQMGDGVCCTHLHIGVAVCCTNLQMKTQQMCVDVCCSVLMCVAVC